MQLKVNGEATTVEGSTVSVAELLTINHVEMPDRVSVQRNGEFVPRDAFATTTVKEGDEVEFLYFMGGGAHQ